MARVHRFNLPPSWAYLLRCMWLDVNSHLLPVFISASLLLAVALAAWRLRPAVSFRLLARAHRALNSHSKHGPASRRLNRTIEKLLASACRQAGFIVALKSASPGQKKEKVFSSGLVLKAPRIQARQVLEKGVLILKFNERIAAFLRSVDMEACLRHYWLVLEPSWTGYADPVFLSFTRFREHPIVLQSPYRGDRQFLENLDSNLVPIALGPGDWVDPRVFHPLENETKFFDAVMIARWTANKRLDLLLRAMRRIADPGFRVALVVPTLPQDPGREGALALIKAFGLQRQIEVFENIPPAAVNRVLNQSKVNLLLSGQEGGNRSLFEGFVAGIPGMAFRHHVGIRVEHFVPETGRLIARNRLVEELLYFRHHWAAFNPRPWALAHITPEVSTRLLNEFLKNQSLQRGEPWTTDIAMKCNRPGLRYYPDDSAGIGLPTMKDLLDRFPPVL